MRKKHYSNTSLVLSVVGDFQENDFYTRFTIFLGYLAVLPLAEAERTPWVRGYKWCPFLLLCGMLYHTPFYSVRLSPIFLLAFKELFTVPSKVTKILLVKDHATRKPLGGRPVQLEK